MNNLSVPFNADPVFTPEIAVPHETIVHRVLSQICEEYTRAQIYLITHGYGT
jgi:hypothetical protein